MSQICIRVKDLVKTYKDLTAVNRISFDVRPGEILGILGPNGSGKTTTLKSILGIIEFDEGSIDVGGLSVKNRRKEILKGTGAILEGARNIYWHLSPRENLTYFAGIRGIPYRAIKERAAYLLESLDLSDVADKEIRQFSSGMKQKCALACAFIHNPSILLLDEPTLGLDVEISRTIRDWLLNVVEKEGKTILITSHNMDFVESICDRILIIRRGEIISHETVASLKEKFARKYFRIDLESEPQNSLLDTIANLGTVSVSGSSLRVELESANHLIPLMKIFDEAQTSMLDFRTVENDLEDIFLEVIREEE
ncbi:MAG: ABC transporter ATP-binding protein [Candidatus Fermentibacteria bacterium]